MKIRKTEILGTINDDGVGIRNVDAVFDDGGREQHIVVVIREIEDNLFQFLRFHLSMTYGYAGIRDILVDHLCDMGEIVDAIIHEIHLAVARHLKVNGISNNLSPKGVDLRLDRIAVGRRRLYDTQVAGTDQRELQGAGNRRCRHRKGIDIRLHLTKFLFRGDTKFLFLVNDQQPQILEFHRFTYQFMGADNNIDLAVGKVFEHSSRLFSRASTSQIIDTHRHILQTS